MAKNNIIRFAMDLFRIVAPLLVVAAGVGGMFSLAGMRETPALEKPAVLPPTVRVETIRTHAGGVDVEVDGLVVPFREIRVAAEVGGRIRYKSETCRAGNYVEDGELLLEIDPIDYQLAVRRLAKELQQAKVSLVELDDQIADVQDQIALAEEDLELQQGEVKRLKSLSSNRFVTESKVDQAARLEVTARNALVKARNQLRILKTRRERLEHAQELAETQLEKAELDRTRTKVIAPVNGVVIEELVEQDSYVQPGAALLTIEDTSQVEVKCNLRLSELYWIWQQQGQDRDPSAGSRQGYELPPTPATVIYRINGHEFAWDGVLTRYDGLGLDEQTRTIPCRVVVKDPMSARALGERTAGATSLGPPALVRGMYTTVRIHASPKVKLFKIPQAAVRPGHVIWLVREGRALRKPIRPVQMLSDGVLVERGVAGLSEGDRVVVSPLVSPHDGMEVTELSEAS